MDPRDHVFINYASEDAVFADWLALRLTAEGYKVWYDRIKLLGGESYPRDIDEAITKKVIRFLAILSRASLHKENPLKERTLALNVGRDRGDDFVIPLKIESLGPSELGFQLVDLTHISFDESWGAGLARLLKKLDFEGAPRDKLNGQSRVGQWLNSNECTAMRPERIWSNLVPLPSIPSRIQLLRLERKEHFNEIDRIWPVCRKDELHVWAFSAPEEGLGIRASPRRTAVLWEGKREILGQRTTTIMNVLIRRAIELDLVRRGLLPIADKREVCFPSGLTPGNRQFFSGPDGKRTYVQVVGERSRKRRDGSKDTVNYHISFGVRPVLFAFGVPACRLAVNVYFSETSGSPLSSGRAGLKRKTLGKSWWNYEWLARVFACASWITGGMDERTVLKTDAGDLTIGRLPLSTMSPISILEEQLGPQDVEGETDLEDEDEGEVESEV